MAATSAAPRRTISRLAAWVPLVLTSEKKRPSRLTGATRALSAPMPEWDSGPLMTHTVPRICNTSLEVESSATTTMLA